MFRANVSKNWEIRTFRENCFSISDPDVSRIFVFFSFRHENFTLTMMLFYVSGKCFKELGDSDISGKVLRKTIKRG